MKRNNIKYLYKELNNIYLILFYFEKCLKISYKLKLTNFIRIYKISDMAIYVGYIAMAAHQLLL